MAIDLMAVRTVFQFILISSVLGVVASESHVKCNNTSPTALGGNVTLTCEFQVPLDVLQVTWQKNRRKTTENMVTYSRKYNVNISKKFESRVSVMHATSTIFSIKLSLLEEEDEACYACLFNAFPNGAFTGEVCLTDLWPPTESEPEKVDIDVQVLGLSGANKDDSEILEVHLRVWLGAMGLLPVTVIFILIKCEKLDKEEETCEIHYVATP